MKTPDVHLDDGAMIEYLDQGDTTAVPHLQTCPECSARYAAFQRDVDHVRALLRSANAPDVVVARQRTRFRTMASAVNRPRRSRLPMIAAGVILLLGGLAMVPPVRALVIRQWQTLITGESAPIPDIAPPDRPLGTATLSFVPASTRLDIAIDQHQSEGNLTLRATDRPAVSIVVSASASGDDILIVASGIRVRNNVDSQASYIVLVPGSITSITTTVASNPALSLSRSDLEAGDIQVPLQRR